MSYTIKKAEWDYSEPITDILPPTSATSDPFQSKGYKKQLKKESFKVNTPQHLLEAKERAKRIYNERKKREELERLYSCLPNLPRELLVHLNKRSLKRLIEFHKFRFTDRNAPEATVYKLTLLIENGYYKSAWKFGPTIITNITEALTKYAENANTKQINKPTSKQGTK